MTDVLVRPHRAVSDDELAVLALAADPDAPLPADAVPLRPDDGAGTDLPAWYMPVPAASAGAPGSWRRRVVYVVVTAFLAIEAAGLYATYGPISFT